MKLSKTKIRLSTFEDLVGLVKPFGDRAAPGPASRGRSAQRVHHFYQNRAWPGAGNKRKDSPFDQDIIFGGGAGGGERERQRFTIQIASSSWGRGGGAHVTDDLMGRKFQAVD